MEIDYVRVYQNTNIGIEEEKAHLDVSIYPNPTSGALHIVHSEKIEKLEVTNIGGLILDIPFENNILYMNGLPNGVYVIHLTTLNGSISHRVIKN